MGFFRRKPDSDQPGPERYEGLRRQALHITQAEVGEGFGEEPSLPILALLMETGFPQGTATLMGDVGGHVSLYLSNGGGILGAGTHPTAAASSRRWLESGVRVLSQLPAIAEPPLPGEGMTQLIAVTPTGPRGAPAVETEELGRKHPLSPFYHAAREVFDAAMHAAAQLQDKGGGQMSDGTLLIVQVAGRLTLDPDGARKFAADLRDLAAGFAEDGSGEHG